MTRIRSSMLLLGLCVVALVIGWLRLVTETPTLPRGSSYSTQPDGAQALYDWADSLGVAPQRLPQRPPADARASIVFILQPEAIFDASERNALDGLIAPSGGTLVLAGDSIAAVLLARDVGLTYEPLSNPATRLTMPNGASLAVASRFRIRTSTPQTTPLLVTPQGDVVALRVPYQGGFLIAIATSDLLTNAAMRNDATARFVFRELLAGGTITNGVGFDEVHHSFAPAGSREPQLGQLLADTSPGRAILYAAALTFVFVLLTGRRLGPALPARGAAEAQRTMFEHVQMLAGLYRRAGRLEAVRTVFAHHYARHERATAATRIQAARTESDLIAAVAAADDPG